MKKSINAKIWLLAIIIIGLQSVGGLKAQDERICQTRLIEDVRQLSSIIENSHPDPYINGGGKIRYHQQLQEVMSLIPVDGLTRDEFYKLLLPLFS